MDQTTSTQTLATGWLASPKADVGVDGTVITSPSYSVEGWLDAVDRNRNTERLWNEIEARSGTMIDRSS